MNTEKLITAKETNLEKEANQILLDCVERIDAFISRDDVPYCCLAYTKLRIMSSQMLHLSRDIYSLDFVDTFKL